MGDRNFILPHEIMDGAGVPDQHREHVAYLVIVARMCALVEAALRENGGKPIRVNQDRVKEILQQDPLTTDPRELVMVKEQPVGDSVHFDVSLATPDEVRAANRRYALSRMGTRRN